MCLLLLTPLAACGDTKSKAATGPSGPVPGERYRQSFCVARTEFQALAQTMATQGSAKLRTDSLKVDKQTRLAYVDTLVHGEQQIVGTLRSGGVPDVAGGQAGADATVAAYQAVADGYAAARAHFAGAATGDRASYLAAVKKLQQDLAAAANSLSTEAAKHMAEIGPAFNAILHCP